MTKQTKVRDRDVRALLDAYPRIYFACHTRHVRDPQTGAALSAHQASILDHLDEVDPMSMTDLAGHMGVTIATMSLAIDRLEVKRYVRRDDQGRFDESDDVGRSLAQDVKKQAKTKVKAGQGDRGDQKR